MKKFKLFFSVLAAMLLFIGYGANSQDSHKLKLTSFNKNIQWPMASPQFQGVLYTQLDSTSGNGWASQQFPDFSNDIGQSADEFVVPAGVTWNIDSIDCIGQFSAAGPMISMRVFIWSDSANVGIRPGVVIYADSNIIPITPLNNPSPTFKLHTSAHLNPGKYWLACVAVQNFTTSGQWFWNARPTRGAPCVFLDPANLFGGGTAWHIISTPPNQAVCFRLRGSSNPIISCPSYYASLWCSATQYPPVPGAGTFYEAAAWLGDTLFVHCPDAATGAATTIINRYSLSGNAWTTGVPLPVAKTQGTLTACNNKLYYIGGGVAPSDGGSNTIYEYSAGAWTLKTPLPGNVNGHAAVCWGDSVIITVCGPWSAPTTNCYFFRPASNTTGSSTPFGGAARRSHAFGIVGNKIFIACGFPFTLDLWIGTIGANASTITWAAGPTPPGVPRSRIGGVGFCDKFYIVGGNNSVGAAAGDSTGVFNIAGNNWTVIPGKPHPIDNHSASVTARIVGDTLKLFCPGGYDGALSYANFEVIGCGGNVVGINNNNSAPMAYNLSQNYPNPFNPTTDIKFSIPKSGLVKIVVFDILGREVKTLVNEFRQTGEYNISFDASSLASGVYFYRIEANEFTQTKKMLLIK